jgi:transcriptional regulator with XRE-family HTH domain
MMRLLRTKVQQRRSEKRAPKTTTRTSKLGMSAAPEHASSEKDLHLDSRLRFARTAKRMRLSDLAAASGCSESLISKIENGKATPSLNTLHRLARGLGTTIAGLLSDGASPNGVVMRQGQRTILTRMGPNGSAVDGVETELLIPFGAKSVLQATLFRVQPGARSDGMMRQHEGDEVGYVVTGEIMLTVAGETYPLRAGDAFFFPSMRPHGVSNPGNSVATIIWVNTPPTL